MAYKTMLRQLISKWGIMSIEMQEAYAKDMATIKENGEYEYVENIETTYEEQPTIVTQENVETKTTEKTANKEVENVEKTTEILPNIKDEEVKDASAENEIQDTVNDTDDFFDN